MRPNFLAANARWTLSVMLGVFAAAAIAAWLYRLLPENPSSTLVGRSSSQILEEAHQERQKFMARLERIAGAGAEKCGVFSLQEPLKNGLTCGAKALSESKSFWLAFELQGAGSEIWSGLAQDARGNTFSVSLDSDQSAGGHPKAEPLLAVSKCACPVIHPESCDGFERNFGFSCTCVVP